MEHTSQPNTPNLHSESAYSKAGSTLLSFLAYSLAAGLLTLVNRYAGQLVPIPAAGTPLAHAVSLAYLGLLLFVLMRAAHASARFTVSIGFQVAAGLALAFPVFISIFSGLGAAVISAPFQGLSATLDALPDMVRFLTSNLLGPIGMILLGTGFGRLFRHPNTLLAGAAFAVFFDIIVVTMGTVAQLMKRGSDVIAAVSVGANGSGAAPMGRLGFPHGHPIPPLSTVTIGPADVLFIGVFLAAVVALRLSPRATFAWMFSLLLFALILVDTTGLPVPALAPMGIAVLIANGRFAAFTRTERRDLWIGAAFALLCAALMIGGARRLLPTPPPRFGFLMGHRTRNGPLEVVRVKPGSPADKAGLRLGDEVLAVGGTPAALLTDATLEQARDASGGLTLRIHRDPEPTPRDLVLRPNDK